MTNFVVKSNTGRGLMEMDNLLDMLQDAREKTGIVGITQKPREEQAVVLRSLMQKFDAQEDMQKILDQRWGIGNKRKGVDPEEKVNEIECRKKTV